MMDGEGLNPSFQAGEGIKPWMFGDGRSSTQGPFGDHQRTNEVTKKKV